MDIGADYNSSWHKGKAEERRAIRKEKASTKVKDTTAPTTTKEKEKEEIPSVKGTHFNKETHSKEHQKEKESIPKKNMKGKGKSKERTHATYVGNKATSQRIAELQCTTLAAMSTNNGRMTHLMTGIKTSTNKDMIKDGTTKIGHNKDMSKGINNQQHRRSHHHPHRQHHQAWHSPSVQWRTPT